MKYYTKKGRVAIVKGDIEATMRCYDATVKGYQSIKKQPRLAIKTVEDGHKTKPDINPIDLDARFSKDKMKAIANEEVHPSYPSNLRRRFQSHPAGR